MTVTFDENGNGSYADDSGLIGKLEWGIDTPPMGDATLYYILPPTQVMTPGDLVVMEPIATAQVISDVLRFVNFYIPGEIPILQNRVYVYSDKEPEELNPDLADVGIPRELQSNNWSWEEVGLEDGSNGALYTPPNNDWAGWMDGGVTYNFISDVPEPATIALLGLGALSLLRRKR
jgi:hypothetical protein